MSLVDLSLSIGPINAPVSVILVAAGLLLAAIVQRTVLRESKDVWSITNDRVFGAALVGFVVWKITPLVTRFAEITDAPLRLVWYAGGTAGLVAGVLASVAFILVRTLFSNGGPSLRDMVVQTGILVAGPLLLLSIGWLVPIDAGRTLDEEPLVYLEGYEASLSGDEPVVLVFWATWCRPCTAQMPEVQRAADRLAGQAGVIAVNMSYTETNLSAVSAYLESDSYTLPVVLDSTGMLTRKHDISATPTTVIFNPDGREVLRRVGAVNADWIVRKVLPLRN